MHLECDHPGTFRRGARAMPGGLANAWARGLAQTAAVGWGGVLLFAALILDPGFLTLGEPTRRLLSAALAAAWTCWALSERRGTTGRQQVWPLAASAALLLSLFWLPVGACGAALAAASLIASRGSSPRAHASARAAAWALAALGVWRCTVQYSSVGWQISDAAGAAWSRLTSLLAGTHVRLGADVAGLPIVLALGAAGAAWTAHAALPERRGRTITGCAVATAALALLASAALLRWRPEGPAPAELCARHLLLFAALLPALLVSCASVNLSAPCSRLPPSAEVTTPLPEAGRGEGPVRGPCSPPQATVFGGGAPGLGERSIESQARPATRIAPSSAAAALGITGVCALLCLGLWLRQPGSLAGKRIGLFVSSSTPWERSASAGYGGVAAATVGDCADLLAALGCRVRRLDGALDASALRDLDAVLIYTPARAFAPAEQAALGSFVRRGGGLMALAEHTDLAGNRDHLNPLLRPFGISVNNDAALAVAGEPWRTAIAVRPHPILPPDATPERYGVAIGASLSVAPAAQPLLVGRGLFADRAAPGPELGDLVYQRPEQLGDIILAATATPGRGRVLVFGDPSPIMNYPLHSTDAMLRRAIRWLTGGPADYGLPVAAGFGLCAGLALLATPGRTRGTRVLAALLAGPLATLVVPGSAAVDRMPLPAGAAALIDDSHREALATSDAFTTSTAGLARGLRRAGLLPSRLDRFDARAVARAGALLLLSPTRDFSDAELAAVDRLLARGGTLLVAIGWAEQPPVPRLCRYLRVRVAPTPLGPVSAPVEGVEAHFPAAWELETRDPAYRTVCARWGRPIVVEGRRKAGRIVVVGDPAVLPGDQMEGHERYDVGNIALFQRLLRGRVPAEAGR